MFDAATITEAHKIAARLGVATSSLLAVAEIESGGKAFAIVDGRKEPLIRFEGHYFDRRLDGAAKKKARAEGLASPKAGAVKNPSSQAARWKLLERARAIDQQAADESVSWGLGQVMGAHWKHLGFRSVDALVSLARESAAGQMELMARFIEKNGLSDELRARNWAAFAKAYNGPGYKANKYDTKMKTADARWAKKLAAGHVPTAPSPVDELTEKEVSSVMRRGSKGEYVEELQKNLNKLGHGPVGEDGVFGEGTEAAVKAFQRKHDLTVDGWAGPKTLEAIGKELKEEQLKPVIEKAEKEIPNTAKEEVKKKSNWWTSITGGLAGLTAFVTALAGMDWKVVLAIGATGIGALVVIFLMRRQIIAAFQEINKEASK